MSLLGMKGALAWNERPVNINEQCEWHAWLCKCEGKAGPPSGFPLRDVGNNPLLQPYVLLSLKHERGRGEANAVLQLCVFDRECVFLYKYIYV